MSQRQADEKPEITIRRAAMDLLARREYAFEELFGKLRSKYPDIDPDLYIRPALSRLKEENLQSDERFVEAFVRYKATRGSGPLKIRAELNQKGVEASVISDQLYNGIHNWRELAGQALMKKFAILSPDNAREYQRYYRFLAQRGFENEDIKAAINYEK